MLWLDPWQAAALFLACAAMLLLMHYAKKP
jgi:hypothetical protein